MKESDGKNKSEMPKMRRLRIRGTCPWGEQVLTKRWPWGFCSWLQIHRYVNGEVIAIDGGVLLKVSGR